LLSCRCVLELHAIACKKEEGGGRFSVAMTAEENQRFLRGIAKDPQQYYSMLGRVNAEASDCTKATDRESIHEGIRRSVGFGKLSRMVFGVMEGWMEEQLRGQAEVHTAAGDNHNAMIWNAVVAAVLGCQGRHDEAVVLFEAVLKFQQHALSDKDPFLGAT
jgi:hypothetical protein